MARTETIWPNHYEAFGAGMIKACGTTMPEERDYTARPEERDCKARPDERDFARLYFLRSAKLVAPMRLQVAWTKLAEQHLAVRRYMTATAT